MSLKPVLARHRVSSRLPSAMHQELPQNIISHIPKQMPGLFWNHLIHLVPLVLEREVRSASLEDHQRARSGVLPSSQLHIIRSPHSHFP